MILYEITEDRTDIIELDQDFMLQILLLHNLI